MKGGQVGPRAAGPLTIPGPKQPLACLWTLAPSLNTIILLTHGASGDAGSGNLPAFAAAFGRAGLPTLSFTARGPLPGRVAAFRAAAAWAARQGATAVVLAGHSMGARAAAAAAAGWGEAGEEAGPRPPLAALALLSFPLHPPGSPGAAPRADRGGLLTRLATAAPAAPPPPPVLAVRGGRDPFSTEAPWAAALARAAAAGVALEVQTVAGGDHGLRCRGGDEASVEGAAAAAAAWVRRVVGQGRATAAATPAPAAASPPAEKRRRRCP